ncbi:GIY-YIG nuclease family protein [uncultured Croceitalea sp.]|uniref:GIY-YIG nuclease family protein n=1 Tax=uncultured Croceitalea sp. TaxID=1798908 RepID=UPI00330585F2
MHYVYVIQSIKDGSFYVGATTNLANRIKQHNSSELNGGVIKRKIPWQYFYTLEVENSKVAFKIERHIKKMKSRIYIENLKKYPEISKKLIEKYS